MRAPIIAGNWKMYKTAAEAEAFARDFLPLVSGVTGVKIVLAPPYLAIRTVADFVRGSHVRVAAQNVHFAADGAYTGEVSAAMIKEAGATYAIIGHSERRQYYAETDESVNRKVKAALEAALTPIMCLGETLQERESGKTFDVVGRQLRAGLAGVQAPAAATVVVAYEPVWAIGTGKTASPAQAQEVHAFLRKRLSEIWGAAAAAEVRILYGGSVKPDNVVELMGQADIDGALVGGASLKPDSFARIVKFK